ncbi:MAG: TVP38/TMEM64 family protein, partial [Phycisphaerales bacterium JB038]
MQTPDPPNDTTDAAVTAAPAPEASQDPSAVEIIKNLGPAGGFGVLTIIIPPIGLAFMVVFMEKIQPWIESLGVWGPLAFAGVMILMAGFSLMPTQVYSVFAGLLIGKAFGLLVGSLTAVGGAVGAAMLMYGWVTLVARDKVMKQIETHRKARIIHHALVDRGFWEELGIITLLRFPPSMPFALSGFVMTSMRVSFIAYSLGTLLGMAPRLIVCVGIGMTLGSLEEAKHNPYKFWFLIVTLVLAVGIVLLLNHL